MNVGFGVERARLYKLNVAAKRHEQTENKGRSLNNH